MDSYQSRFDLAKSIVINVYGTQHISEGMIDALANRLVSSQDGAMGNAVTQAYTDDVSNVINKSKRKKLVVVKTALTAREQEKNREMFNGEEIRCSNQGNASNHPLGCAAREIETQLTMRKCGRTKPVIDIGGNYVNRVMGGHYNVHSCVLGDYARDVGRYTNNELALASYVHETKRSLNYFIAERDKPGTDTVRINAIVKDLEFKLGKVECFDNEHMHNDLRNREKYGHDYRCFKDAALCNVQAKIGVCVEANYDISLDHMARIMDSHGLEVVYGYFICTEDIMHKPNGVIENLDLVYSIDYDADTITFTFVNDTSFCYEHKWSIYKQYMVSNVVVSDKGNCYSYMKMASKREFMSMRFVRCRTQGLIYLNLIIYTMVMVIVRR